jgi:predicted metal-binding membrane protein
LRIAAIADTPKVMTEGNWRLGVFVDDRATDDQAEKLIAVFTGRLGGPMAGIAPLVGEMCLGKCRSPLGFLLGAWRDGRRGAPRMGVRHGAWCVGCRWALMASLFALGLMSLVWMAFVLGLIAVEKVLPWRRVARYGTGAVLLVLGVLMLAAPDAIPALTIPGWMSEMG